MPTNIHRLFLAALILLPLRHASAAETLPLAGSWRFDLDRTDGGIASRWFDRALTKEIHLPGVMQAQGFGDDITLDTPWIGQVVDRSYFTSPKYAKYREPGNIKIPFWLQPDKYYAGAAWYQRDVEIPQDWLGKRITLHLERCHWATQAWLDQKDLGSCDRLGTPHVYDLGTDVSPGKHRLTLRVDNRLVVNIGPNSHSVSDHTQGNWNGVVGDLSLRATDPVWLDDVQVYTQTYPNELHWKLVLRNSLGKPGKGVVRIRVEPITKGEPLLTYEHKLQLDDRPEVALEIPQVTPDEMKCWDEFHPVLYRSVVELEVTCDGRKFADRQTTTIGRRTIGVKETQFTINGQRIFLRGTLECCIFPRTSHPPTDLDSWRHIFSVCKAHGLNHMRFHSWCPPPAAFDAADQMGMYLYVECSSWANQGSSVGDGKPVDRWIYAEGDAILREYGNHPSFILMSYGNEPGGANQKEYLGRLVDSWKAKDNRRLYTGGAGWPAIPQNQWHLTPAPRIQGWGQGLSSRINAQIPETRTDYRDYVAKAGVPLVSHEIGQWCVYPNFDEIPKYTGLLKAKNFEIFRDSLTANHMGDQARPFLMASGKLQTLCYKEEIESALRTPGFGGFHLLDLHDFPGQGTALVGVLDPFWDSKPYVSPAEFHRFCGPTVPLARMDKRTWNTAETFSADLDLAHYGAEPLGGVVAAWRLVDTSNRPVAAGDLPACDVPSGGVTSLGKIVIDLGRCSPGKYRLVAGLKDPSVENDWDIWIYPEKLDVTPPAEIHLATQLDDAVLARLRAGGKVLLAVPASEVATPVKIGFSSIFWNTAWTNNQPPHTLGILCDPKHPALGEFPTEYHTNYQWWELIHGSAAMVLDGCPPELRPLVQPIDTWFENRRLGLLFEAEVEGGKLMVSSMDLTRCLNTRVAARQMRHSVLDYMAGPAFRPSVRLDVAQVRALLKPPSALRWIGVKQTQADSAARGYEASLAVDGDPTTLWHTAWDPKPAPMPHELQIALKLQSTLLGVTYLPRQDMANGRIDKFQVFVSLDGRDWGAPVAAGRWPNTDQLQTVRFAQPVRANYLKLVAESEVNDHPFAAVAEIDVIPGPP